MKYVRGYDAEITSIERIRNTRNGSPKFMLTFKHSGGVISAFTKTNGVLAQNIESSPSWSRFMNNPVYVEIGQHYGLNTIDSIAG
jgi:hypothetical protein